jgi:hypothetical protein
MDLGPYVLPYNLVRLALHVDVEALPDPGYSKGDPGGQATLSLVFSGDPDPYHPAGSLIFPRLVDPLRGLPGLPTVPLREPTEGGDNPLPARRRAR